MPMSRDRGLLGGQLSERGGARPHLRLGETPGDAWGGLAQVPGVGAKWTRPQLVLQKHL